MVWKAFAIFVLRHSFVVKWLNCVNILPQLSTIRIWDFVITKASTSHHQILHSCVMKVNVSALQERRLSVHLNGQLSESLSCRPEESKNEVLTCLTDLGSRPWESSLCFVGFLAQSRTRKGCWILPRSLLELHRPHGSARGSRGCRPFHRQSPVSTRWCQHIYIK